jgi:adenylate kinase family enzyme
VPDDIVIELVNQQLTELENEGKDYIIEGYPNTRVQANALQQMGIVPEKFFILKVTEPMIIQKIKENISANNEEKEVTEVEMEQIAKNAITEYNM